MRALTRTCSVPARVGKRLVLSVLLSGLASGCLTEPITGRQLALGGLISEAEANAMGAQAYEQVVAESPLSNDAPANASVARVGGRIAGVVDELMVAEGRPQYEWEFRVIDEAAVNAFALPGGKVAFYQGILPVCDGETGIAVVMGHEIAHAYAQHGRVRVSRQVVSTVGLQAVQAALGGEEEGSSSVREMTLAALGVGTTLVSLHFSREDESAADHIGLILMARAGYDPREAVAFWKRMDELAGGPEPPVFLSTHPSHATRVAELEALLPEALAEYEKAQAGG